MAGGQDKRKKDIRRDTRKIRQQEEKAEWKRWEKDDQKE